MKKLALTLSAILVAVFFISCEKDNSPSLDTQGYADGIYIINEGAFNSNTGSISYMKNSDTLIINDIFNAANSRPLGDIVQSLSVVNDSLGFIVVNNSAKIEIVRLRNFQAIIEPLQVEYPRYSLQVSPDKVYITSGSIEGKVFITDLNSLQITDSINVGFGPEMMVQISNKVYVANSGGWVSDSTISVIDAETDLVLDTLAVEKVPVDMVIDQDDHIWVYCKGYTNYSEIETDSYIIKMNAITGEVIWKGRVGAANDYAVVPAKCAVSANGDLVYYLRPDGIYRLDVSNPVIADAPLIAGNFYGLDVHPENGRIFLFETSSFTGNGTVKIYEPTGILYSQGMVGIGPNGAVFNLH